MDWNTVEAQSLEEGNEILLSPNTGETGIVEEVRPARWSGPDRSGKTHVVVTLCDGREFTLRREYPARISA